MDFKALARRLSLAALAIFAASAAAASTVSKLPEDAFAALRGSRIARRIVLDTLPIYDSKRSVIQLEEFQVWAPDGKVVIHGDNGVVLQTLDPPPMRFFRGLVNGDPESFAYFSMDASGRVEGLIVTRDKRYSVASARRPASPHTPRSEGWDSFLTAFDYEDSAEDVTGQMWQCDTDKRKIPPASAAIHATGWDGLPIAPTGISGTQSYAIKIDIETDYELYVNAGNNSTNLAAYITNLTGAVSTIYNRDLKTNVTQGQIHIYTTASDPWAATDASSGLDELGDYYHVHYGGPTASSVVFLSGKAIGSGIAWEAIACGGEFYNGTHYGGPYAWCGGIANLGTVGLGTIPDPNASVNGILYGMPSGTQTYWPLEEYAHELGHNLAGHHTHCVAITDAERIAAGFTDGSPATSASDFVDHCYATEGTGCYSGSNYVAGSESAFNGTIMSYCHNVFLGSIPQSRFTFGQPTEPSHHELDDYMLNPSGPPLGNNIVSAVGTFTISSITAPSSVTPSSTGNTASITASPAAGATYAWTISNGTITTSPTASSIAFTAGASGMVTLRATSYGANRCGVTDTKAITISSATYNPPTNVVAAATGPTTVTITWTAATGTTPGRYNVYRSADHLTFSPAGNTTGTAFSDTGALASTSYLYKVRSAASDGSNESGDSNLDLATTVIYTYTITAGSSIVRAVDMTQMRTAVTALRVLSGQMTTSFTNAIAPGATVVHAMDVSELRTYINNARSAVGLGTLTFSHATLTPGASIVSAVDFNELRAGMQ